MSLANDDRSIELRQIIAALIGPGCFTMMSPLSLRGSLYGSGDHDLRAQDSDLAERHAVLPRGGALRASAWLWGVDEYAGRDYSHRKGWVLERLAQQAFVFAIDICAYAVLSNHYHLVLHVDRERTRSWTLEEVARRWTQLFSAPPLIERWRNGQGGPAEREAVERIVESWRGRLSDISWFMKCLNEPLARRANAEDRCTGRFWEGRFRSQALLDEAGWLTAMAYVDLNPFGPTSPRPRKPPSSPRSISGSGSFTKARPHPPLTQCGAAVPAHVPILTAALG